MLAVLVFAILAARPTDAAARPGGPLCTGRYRLSASTPPLIVNSSVAASGPDAVVLEPGQVTIESGCPPVVPRLRRTRLGWKLGASWPACGTLRGVRLKATLPQSCRVLHGRLSARPRPLGRRFGASLVRCGDGVLDADAGEACDDGNLEGGDGCNDCHLPRCGDGVLDPGEECDDGNQDDGDGCSPGCRGVCDGPQFASTWEAIQKVVFAQGGCTQALCHGSETPAGGLDLRPASAYANLIGVRATIDPGWTRVVPGDQAASLLWRKLAAATHGVDDVPGAPMPQAGAPLAEGTLEALRRWIRGGARDTGVVVDTAGLLDACLGPTTPGKIVPPAAPAPQEGFQLYAPPWVIPAHDEDEVCFATTYDIEAALRATRPDALVPCPPDCGGASRSCVAYRTTDLTQDPNSHHSIINVYRGAAGPTDTVWGGFTCHDGPRDRQACVPTVPGVAAPAGAECGARSGCAGSVVSSVACIGYGPGDFGFSGAGFAGSQAPHARQAFSPGVYDVLPVRGVVVWNSHAFNPTGTPTTNEQWLDILFAAPDERRHRVQTIFDLSRIFDEDVPPFGTQEICNAFQLPPGARLFQLSSHTHKRGKLFRVWDPEGQLVLTTTDYSDPAVTRFDPPRAFDDPDPTTRTLRYCARYDNGASDPRQVKRRSTSPSPPGFGIGSGGPCGAGEVVCLGGPHQGELCGGDDRRCAGRAGTAGGVCDACPLRGGVTTEDEMFILLGSYYLVP